MSLTGTQSDVVRNGATLRLVAWIYTCCAGECDWGAKLHLCPVETLSNKALLVANPCRFVYIAHKMAADGVKNTPILWAIYTDLHGFATRGALLESGQLRFLTLNSALLECCRVDVVQVDAGVSQGGLWRRGPAVWWLAGAPPSADALPLHVSWRESHVFTCLGYANLNFVFIAKAAKSDMEHCITLFRCMK